MKKKQIIYSSIAAVLIVIAVAFFGMRYMFYQGYIRMNYPSFEEYPVQGIDISHHQKHIDWDKLDKQSVQFIFMKATEGVSFKDSLYAKNLVNAKRLDIPVSAYHFFSFCKSGREQADNFIEAVPKDSFCLPPSVDLEFGGNCQEANRVNDLMYEISEFIRILEDHYQKKVIIYSTNEFYESYLKGNFFSNPIWIRDILGTPKLKENRKWVFWQFTNRGHIDGIHTVVDQNVFAGSKADFGKFRSASCESLDK